MSTTVNLDMTRFGEFVRLLSIFKDLCNDVDIREGKIRQKTNDATNIFEIDLSNILSDINIPIVSLKDKLDLLKCFMNEEISIEADDNSYRLSDRYSTIRFLNPDLSYLDNKFLTRSDLETSISTNPEDLLISTSISRTFSDRIRVISQGFHVNTLHLRFTGATAALTSNSQGRDQFASFVTDIPVEQEMNNVANLNIVPFIFDHDGDILFEVYKFGEDRTVNKFSTTISDINITVYSRSQLLTEDEGGTANE